MINYMYALLVTYLTYNCFVFLFHASVLPVLCFFFVCFSSFCCECSVLLRSASSSAVIGSLLVLFFVFFICLCCKGFVPSQLDFRSGHTHTHTIKDQHSKTTVETQWSSLQNGIASAASKHLFPLPLPPPSTPSV